MSAALTTTEVGRLAELEATVERGLQTFVEVGQALVEIRDSRLYRDEHASFEDYCRERFDFSRQRAHQLIGAAEVSTVVDVGNERQARELLPLKGDEAELRATWADLRKRHGDRLTAAKVREAVDARMKREKRQELQAQRRRERDSKAAPPDAWRVEECAALDLDVSDVDAIITDPPYPREYLGVWKDLALLAARCLKPGGSLLAMSGQSYLVEILNTLDAQPELTYRWQLTYMTPGAAQSMHQRRLNTFWKPVLWFVKGPIEKDARYLGSDIFRSDSPDKAHHEWGQSESGMADLVDRLTEPGELVVDPFVGGGTTAVVATQMGRRFLSCDIDPQAVERTRARLAA